MRPSIIQSEIREIIKKEFGLLAELFTIVPPPSYVKYDAATNFAMICAKRLSKKPDEIAKKLIEILKSNGFNAEFISGFVNIEFPLDIYIRHIKKILSCEKPFFKEENSKEKINIEFVSANPTGPLHLASASGAALGDSLAKIFSELGYSVSKEYYVNDCGRQVRLLGESLLSRYLGKEPPEDGYHGEYLIEIALLLPPQAKNWAANNDVEKFSKFAIDLIVKQQKEDLERFGVKFDRWFYESELYEEKLPEKVLEILKEKGAVEQKNGALWLKTGDEKDKERVLKRSDGTNTYFLNDLAYHWTKFKRGFTRIIDIWGADHYGYISRMKAGIGFLGFDESKFTVVIHQLVSIKKEGEILKMSKRAGKFYTLRQLIEETSSDAVRFFFTMRSPNTHLVFDTDLAKKQSDENPLYYVQYAHARISSIIKNAYQKKIDLSKENFDGYVLNDDDRRILKRIFWFEKVIEECEKELTPHHITLYLIDTAKDFHSYYEKNRVIDENKPDQTAARIFILKGLKAVIKKGLDIIGVSAPELM